MRVKGRRAPDGEAGRALAAPASPSGARRPGVLAELKRNPEQIHPEFIRKPTSANAAYPVETVDLRWSYW